ncbi:MAG: hypothetical protein FWD57_03430, partial [Polyangiaceae bacterium]|nr:hypothetical protein [Polyangiaceae bacterium]
MDLVKPEVRELFRWIWTDPLKLNPSLRAATATQEVAGHLSTLARMLEVDGQEPSAVSQFLMRCIFSMFAQAVGLLPSGGFTKILEISLIDLPMFQPLLREFWQAMNFGQAFATPPTELKRSGGTNSVNFGVLPLRHEHLLILMKAATANWTEVEPAIFGTLLEQALNPKERHKLGAYYTPRVYVERLINPTLMDPLREDWEIVQAAASDHFRKGQTDEARKVIETFRASLHRVRVLDPACGSGNFLYVAMEHMKRLECEILQTLESYGEKQIGPDRIGPHQFLGLEINPRAALIAETVLWIGHLQWHFRNDRVDNPPEPLIRKYGNIQQRDAVLEYAGPNSAVDKNGIPILRWDGETYKIDGVTGQQVPDLESEAIDEVYKGAAAAKWPNADFIIGNPPFIGGKYKKQVLGHRYFDALGIAYPMLPESCDFVMYWWHKAAELLRIGKVRRFGFITTNSISQVFNRRVLSLHMESENPMYLAFAVPDHPWEDAPNNASVRIAMTVGAVPAKGSKTGTLSTVLEERPAAGTDINLVMAETVGMIHANLRQGPDITKAISLKSNERMSTNGVKLHGSGFIVTPSQAADLGLGRIRGLESHIRHYRNGKDIAIRPRGVMVIDLHGLSAQDIQANYPQVYQWVCTRVKPERDVNHQEYRRKNWWLFGGTNMILRNGLAGLPRYIATIETSARRFFVFLPAEVLPDNMLVNILSSDAYHLGVLSSRIHTCWTLATGGTLGTGHRYTKSVCFDAFPFPNATPHQQNHIRELGEKLDSHRKSRQEEHPNLTMTGMYNVLEAMRAGRTLIATEKTIHENGQIAILCKLHDEIDVAVANAYG